jgi:hypothetical protein
VTSCRATAHQSVTQELRSIAEAPDREGINRLAPRAYLNVVPNEGLTPVAPATQRKKPEPSPSDPTPASPEKPVASYSHKRLLDLCLISAVPCRCGQPQNLPISRHFSNGASRDRTGDLLLAKQALSQLSYGPWNLQYTRYRTGAVADARTRYSLKSKSRGGRCSNQRRSCSGVSRRKSGVSSSTSSTGSP